MSDLNIKYAELQPFLEQIDQIDESVSRFNIWDMQIICVSLVKMKYDLIFTIQVGAGSI